LEFPAGTPIPPYERLLVVGFDPAVDVDLLSAFETEYETGTLAPGVDIIGPWKDELPAVGRVALEKPQAPDILGESVSWVIVDEAFYFDRLPWPTIPPGSALQRRPGPLSGNDSSAWRAALPSPARQSMTVADVDGNAAVDLADFSAFTAGWLSESGDGDWEPRLDIALPPDGIVDIRDLHVLSEHWLWQTQNVP
jgi:hypothetical protein